MHEKNIQSILVEGGSKLLQSFIDQNLWDEAIILEGKVELQEGTKAPIVNRNNVFSYKVGKDIITQLKN